MKKVKKYYAIVLFLAFLVPLLNDMEDTLVHHYEKSIFNPGTVDDPDYGSWWYPDPLRKYNVDTTWSDGPVDPVRLEFKTIDDEKVFWYLHKLPNYKILSRKTFFDLHTGIVAIDYFLAIPAWWFDAWHFVKIIRWWMIFNMAWFIGVYFLMKHNLEGRIFERKYNYTIMKMWIRIYIKWLIRYAVMIWLVHLVFYSSLFVMGG